MPWTDPETKTGWFGWNEPDRVDHVVDLGIRGCEGTEQGFVLSGISYPSAESAEQHNLGIGVMPGTAQVSSLSVGVLQLRRG